MLYTRKAAAYLVALTLTLLFTTSEADFDIEKGKAAVNTLLNHLTSIVLEHQTNNLDDLIVLEEVLLEAMGFSKYLYEVPEDEQYSRTMLNRIHSYQKTFAEYLRNANLLILVNGKFRVIEALIPMNDKLCDLKEILEQKTFWTEPEQLLVDALANINLRKIKKKTLYKRFIPLNGITEILLLQSDLLKLVFDEKCNDLSFLNDIAGNIMNEQTKLYRFVLLAMDEFADAIKGEIEEYKKVIRDALSNDLQDVVLSKIQEICETQSGEGSSQKGNH